MHKAIIAKITETTPIPGADRIHVAKVLGESVIVSKEWKEDMVGVLFPVDLQLSEEFCHHNNLFRDSEKNKDKTKKGFFENNRRVRAQPFLKVKSRSEEHTSELQSRPHLVCRLLLEKKKKKKK